MLFSAWISSSQPLHEPASTSRMESERPSRRRAAPSTRAASSASAASSGAGAGSVSGPCTRRFSSSVRISKIVSRVRAVERLIAEREVGDDVAFDRRFEQRPLEPGRVAQMAARDAAVRAHAHPEEDIAAKAFDQRDAFAATRAWFDVSGSRGYCGHELLDQRDALSDFADADPDACV